MHNTVQGKLGAPAYRPLRVGERQPPQPESSVFLCYQALRRNTVLQQASQLSLHALGLDARHTLNGG